MPLKYAPASVEETEFAAKVNDKLRSTGAKVTAFSVTESADNSTAYHLTFQYGTRRHTIRSDAPFHLDSVDDIEQRVKRWLASSGTNNLYSPDLKYAE